VNGLGIDPSGKRWRQKDAPVIEIVVALQKLIVQDGIDCLLGRRKILRRHGRARAPNGEQLCVLIDRMCTFI
jgi:hypothetical protein